MTTPSSREQVLALFKGQRSERFHCFSGLINVTVPGLESVGLRLGQVHQDPVKMAAAAATTYRLFGFESAVVPLDLCVEAEALGVRVDFQEASEHPELPRVAMPLAASFADMQMAISKDMAQCGRIPIVLEAIRILKEQVGQEIIVGAWVPGPFTLAVLLVQTGSRFMKEITSASIALGRTLDALTEAIIQVALAYRAAGADLITVHEMGGSPAFIGPPRFKSLVLPRLQRLLAALPPPRVLSVCGNTNSAMRLLAEAGADALNVDQTNDLAKSRATLGPGAILFGNIDPVEILAFGDEAKIRDSVACAIQTGADAIWPGCDLWPMVPEANMRVLMDEVRSRGRG